MIWQVSIDASKLLADAIMQQRSGVYTGFVADHGLALKLRLILGALFLSAIFTPSLYTLVLDNLWDFLKSNKVYQASYFETLWTVFCYAAIEPYITHVFIQNPQWRFTAKGELVEGESKLPLDGSGVSTHESPIETIVVPQTTNIKPTYRTRPKGMKRPSRRAWEGLTYVLPLLLLDLTMIKKFSGVSLEAKLLSGNYDPRLATRHSGHFMLPSVHNFTLDSPLQTTRALPEVAPSSMRLAFELLTSFFIYDTAFFLFHLALHVIPPLSRYHNTHHAHGPMHPQITNQLSIAERMGLVLLANFSLNIIGAHVLTRTLFVPIFVWLLVEVHAGMDVPWGLEKILPHGWAGGSRKHARHHAGGKEGLEPFFGWWDALLERTRVAKP